MNKADALLDEIIQNLEAGEGRALLGAGHAGSGTGRQPRAQLARGAGARAGSKVSVPHKLRGNLTAAAQFIENFKHRKSVVHLMEEAFRPDVEPAPLHRYLAGLTKEPLLIVDAWYDNAMAHALQSRCLWGASAGHQPSRTFWYLDALFPQRRRAGRCV